MAPGILGFDHIHVYAQDHELYMSLYFSDPDGNPYEITTYEYAAAKGQ